MNDRLLITGSSGFVGGNLKEYLHQSYDVVGVSRNKSKSNLTYLENC